MNSLLVKFLKHLRWCMCACAQVWGSVQMKTANASKCEIFTADFLYELLYLKLYLQTNITHLLNSFLIHFLFRNGRCQLLLYRWWHSSQSFQSISSWPRTDFQIQRSLQASWRQATAESRCRSQVCFYLHASLSDFH